MQRYEVTYPVSSSQLYKKPTTALVIEPDRIGSETGAMLFTHGWGGNRFQYEETMAYAANEFDVVCISVEFRQSGYDFNSVTGHGACCPYDASFYQVFDVLNGLRFLLQLRPGLNRSRLIHYGGSQGGHIALLSAVFAPGTFAGLYVACPATHIDEKIAEWAGRSFAPHELAIRNAFELSDRIRCPVVLEYGTADSVLDCDRHFRPLGNRLRRTGWLVRELVYEGGDHDLSPVITRLESFKNAAPEVLPGWSNPETDDFLAGSTVQVPAADRTLIVDWSKGMDDPSLVTWDP